MIFVMKSLKMDFDRSKRLVVITYMKYDYIKRLSLYIFEFYCTGPLIRYNIIWNINEYVIWKETQDLIWRYAINLKCIFFYFHLIFYEYKVTFNALSFCRVKKWKTLRSCVNFINVKRTNFLYECCFSKFNVDEIDTITTHQMKTEERKMTNI